jgi:hypothetical protein
LLYSGVFVFRYLDLLIPSTYKSYGSKSNWHILWNVFFKLFYLSSSFYTIFLMMKVFPRTRERERAWKLGLWSVAGSLALTPFAILILDRDIVGPWILEVSSERLAEWI